MDSNKLLEKFKLNIAIEQFKNENTLKEETKWKRYAMKRKLVVGLCGGIILVSGVTFAANYNKIIRTFFLGKGLDDAAQNGYIENPDMNYVNSNTTATDKIHHIELKDLIITDEENKILYCMNQEALEKYCKENNLDEKYLEFSDNYYNCGLNVVIENHNKQNGIVNFTYNIYTGDKSFPKSKKLNFKFTEIQLKREEWLENENSIVNLKGNWNIDVNVPEKMYNRQSIAYKVVNCENSDFQITNAILTNTGFEFGMIISNIKEPEQPQILNDLWKEYSDGKINIDELNRRQNEDEEIRKAYGDCFRERQVVAITDWECKSGHKDIEKVTYVENEKGEKFESTMSPSRRADGNFIDGNKYSFYETFGLTTYTATDKLKVRVLFKDKPYIVELEKMHN